MYEWIAPSGVRVVSCVPRPLDGGFWHRLYQTMRHRIFYTVACSEEVATRADIGMYTE